MSKYPEVATEEWTVPLRKDAIDQTVKEALKATEVDVSFLFKGNYTQTYEVVSNNTHYLMRLQLPVDPRHKTLSQVATLNWVRQNTKIPIPKVIAYDATRENIIGYEWILIEKMPGRPLNEIWNDLTEQAKSWVVRQIAEFTSMLFRNQLRGIGSLCLSASSTTKVGTVVSLENYHDILDSLDVPRGPFHSTRDELLAVLETARIRSNHVIALGPQPDDGLFIRYIKRAKITLDMIEKLKDPIRRRFPGDLKIPEPSMLEPDLSPWLILVDQTGKVTALLGWAYAEVKPLWEVCKPSRDLMTNFPIEPPDKLKILQSNDGNPDELLEYYLKCLMKYELHQLYPYFVQEMGRIEPEWRRIFESSDDEKDYANAVKVSTRNLSMSELHQWLADVASGRQNRPKLEDRILEPPGFDPNDPVDMQIEEDESWEATWPDEPAWNGYLTESDEESTDSDDLVGGSETDSADDSDTWSEDSQSDSSENLEDDIEF